MPDTIADAVEEGVKKAFCRPNRIEMKIIIGDNEYGMIPIDLDYEGWCRQLAKTLEDMVLNLTDSGIARLRRMSGHMTPKESSILYGAFHQALEELEKLWGNLNYGNGFEEKRKEMREKMLLVFNKGLNEDFKGNYGSHLANARETKDLENEWDTYFAGVKQNA